MKIGNKLDKKVNKLLEIILSKGIKKEDRTGTGTLSLFDMKLKHDMKDGFPIQTSKKVFLRGTIEELIWFLNGETNIKTLVDKNVNIWVGDAYKKYKTTLEKELKILKSSPKELKRDIDLIHGKGTIQADFDINEILSEKDFIEKIKTDDEFADKWGELGPVYGFQWRKWKRYYYDDYGGTFSSGLKSDKPVDQILNLIHDLKHNPDSRRLIVSAWNVGELDEMTLPPCHNFFQCYTRDLTPEEILDYKENNDDITYWPTKAISLKWNQRSVDTGLGLSFNIASYGTLLTILGKIVNMVPDKLSGSFGDTHIYSNHIEGVKEQISRPNIYDLPHMQLVGEFQNVEKYWKDGVFDLDGFLSKLTYEDFKLNDYKSHPIIKLPLSN